jgi:hypothetical protein
LKALTLVPASAASPAHALPPALAPAPVVSVRHDSVSMSNQP